MFEEIPASSKYYYHSVLSFIMLVVWVITFFKGYKSNNNHSKYRVSIWIIFICLAQEMIDYINRFFLDSNYLFSIQRDLPLLQFCQIAFYFSLLCIFLTKKEVNHNARYSMNQFLFDSAFLLGFSGAFQGIVTPDFHNINNFTGVICIQLQHSLIILNIVWLMSAFSYRLTFSGVCFTYLLINAIAPLALLLNKFLGANSSGEHANYFYVNQLPEVNNFFLNFISDYPSPDYILYIQPIFIIYFLLLYAPFAFFDKNRK